MKVKVSELQGAALDWAVAKCEGKNPGYEYTMFEPVVLVGLDPYSPSTDWTQGGPIIERERISVEPCFDLKWVAIRTESPNSAFEEEGPTPLVAAMRCYVASKLGDEIELPEEVK